MADRSDSPLDDKQVAALSAMYQSEISANVGELQASTSIVLGLLAYLAATVVFIDHENGPSTVVLALLPMGAVFGCTFQMLRAAVVVRRAALARVYERQLADVVGFAKEYDARALGSPFYGQLDDIGIILEKTRAGKRKKGWLVQAMAAALAYFGLYLLSVAYTVSIMWVVWKEDGVAWTSIVGTLFYLTIGAVLAWAAQRLFAPAHPGEIVSP